MAYSNIPAAWPPDPITRSYAWINPIRLAAVTVTALSIAISGCAESSAPVSLAEGKQIAASCPEGHQVAGRAAIDVSTHMRAIAADAGRLDPLRELVRRVMICDGHLRVDAFSGSSAATANVFDGDLAISGATENARLRREPAKTDEVMAAISKQLPTAAAKLPLTGSDIVAQLGMDAEFVQQLDPAGSRYVLDALIVTDGVQSEGVALTDPSLTVEHATALAGRVRVPKLPNATLRFTSIGKTANPAPPTEYVNALKAFFTTVCTATGAVRCTVVTDGTGH